MPLVTRFANQGQFYLEATEPPNTLDGDLWSDTTANTLKLNVSGTFETVGVSSFSDAVTVSYSQTIGDYVQPDSAVATSAADLSGDVVLDPDSHTMDNTGNSVQNVKSFAVDLGAGNIPTDDWEARFPLDMTAFTARTDTNTQYSWVGFRSLSVLPDAYSDSLGLLMFTHTGVGNKFYATTGENTALGNLDNELTGYGLQTGQIYVKMKLVGTNSFTITLYSNSNYTDGQLATVTVDITSKTIENLRYWYGGFQKTYGSNNGTIDIDVDALEGESGILDTHRAAFAVDDSTSTYWESLAQTNPAIYVAEGENNNYVGCAIYWKTSTETEITISVSTDTSFTTPEIVRTILTSALTNGAWNYIRFNVKNGRYMQIRGSSGSSKVLSLYEIKSLIKTDSEILLDLGILVISPTNTTLALDGT